MFHFIFAQSQQEQVKWQKSVKKWIKRYGRLTDHTYSCNSLTNFKYGTEIKWIYWNLQKLSLIHNIGLNYISLELFNKLFEF